MATSSSPSGRRTTTRRTTTRRPRGSTARRSTSTSRNSTQPRTTVGYAQVLAERVVLVPVGASLVARDNLVGTVRDLVTRYRTRAGVERELKRYERRATTARNRFERRVRRTRTRVERDLRQRRNRIERVVQQNRRRFRREVRSVRRDVERQSGQVGTRFEKLVNNAQERIGSAY